MLELEIHTKTKSWCKHVSLIGLLQGSEKSWDLGKDFSGARLCFSQYKGEKYRH